MAARILSLLLLVLEALGLSISLGERKWKVLAYYTQLSNLLTAVSALCLLLFGSRQWVAVLRYLGTCMLIMTFFVTTCVLIPMGGEPKKLLWSGNGLFHHVLCPAVSVGSYLLAEEHAGGGWIWLPAAVTLCYGLVMLYLNGIRKADGPYPFFRVHNQPAQMTVLWMLVLMAAVTSFSALVWIAAR